MWWLIFIIPFCLFWYQLEKSKNYWKKRGVNYIKSTFFFGRTIDGLLKGKTRHEVSEDAYNQFPGARYYGISEFFKPTFVIRDPELIKQIIIKDFDHFAHHEHQLATKDDPFWSRNVFELTGIKWRKWRQITSPMFTSSRMRMLYELMKKNAEQFTNYLNNLDGNLQEFQMRTLFSKYTTDVTANTAFGISCDSLKEPDNEFLKMCENYTNLKSLSRQIKLKFIAVAPKYAELFRFTASPKQSIPFWKNIVDDVIATRKSKNINRSDAISFMMETQKRGLNFNDGDDEDKFEIVDKIFVKTPPEISNLDIASQSVNFLLADFEGVAATMGFLAYELALNPAIQTKLYQEILKAKQKSDGILDYNTLNKIDYLDMVVTETFRKWSVTITLDRVCTKKYEIPPKLPGESPVIIEEGQKIIIPVYGLQMDPDYFPNPKKFDPERFSKENGDNIVPYTYLSFGSGPRACLGTRYVFMEIKILFAQLLMDFEIVPTKKTEIPLPLRDNYFYIDGKNGIWLGFKSRNIS